LTRERDTVDSGGGGCGTLNNGLCCTSIKLQRWSRTGYSGDGWLIVSPTHWKWMALDWLIVSEMARNIQLISSILFLTGWIWSVTWGFSFITISKSTKRCGL